MGDGSSDQLTRPDLLEGEGVRIGVDPRDLQEVGDQALEAAEIALPGMFWVIVGITLTIFAGISSLLMTSAFRAGIVCAQAAILGVLLAAVFINDEPFKGETSIRPTAYIRFLEIFNHEAD